MTDILRVLVVAAHADDETLGCGGTIRKHASAGHAVSVLHLADGVTSRPSASDDDIALREAAAHKAAEILGCNVLKSPRLPDNKLDSIALLDVIRFVEAAKADVDPDIVYTHHPGDLNVDHRVASAATLTAFRPTPGQKFSEVRAFEVLSSTEWSMTGQPFVPDTFINISKTIDAKLRAYQCYISEVPPDPHPRSLEAVRSLANLRGRNAGMASAEAFVTLRRIVRN